MNSENCIYNIGTRFEAKADAESWIVFISKFVQAVEIVSKVFIAPT